MKRVVHVVLLTGLMTFVAGWLTGVPAGATTPSQVFHMQINQSLPNINVCGFTVDSVVQGTFTSQTFFDHFGNVSSIQNESHVVSTLTNVANGKVVYVEGSGRDSFQPNPVVNPDGTITQSDTLTGIDNRVYTSHRSVLVTDDGFLSITGTFDSQGNLLSVQVIEHGPHQFAGDFTVESAAIASAIG
jgi:hypothetical protein